MDNIDSISTNTTPKMSVLLVDDDKGILFTLRKLVEKNFPNLIIQTAENGQAGLDITIDKHPAIIISDYSMPVMNGMEFLKRVRGDKQFDDIFFIMLTANTDSENRRTAINLGADEFISKPILTEAFEARLKSAIRIIKLQFQQKIENQRLVQLASELEDTVQDMAKLSVKFMHARIPTSYQTLQRVAKASLWIARQLNKFSKGQMRDIGIAAFMSQVGRITLPDTMVGLPILTNGKPTNDLMMTIPAASRDIVSTIKRFDNIGKILFCIYENIDGSGFPNHLRSWQIPFESRIIRICLDFEELCNSFQKTPGQAYDIIVPQSQRMYDHRAVILLGNYLRTTDKEFISTYMPVKLSELRVGMVLGRDVVTDNGLKLLNAGVTLTQSIIDKIIAHSASDPIVGNLFVKKA
jgi:response regulator RpfG family c-di-GMP phosphodiesterase